MRVIHIAPLFLPLDPEMKYGGIERIIISLMKKEGRLGVDLRAIASSDSTIPGLLPTTGSIGVGDIYSTTISKDVVRGNSWSKMEHVAETLRYIEQNRDAVFHVHDDYLLPFLDPNTIPFVLTLHSPYEDFWMNESHPKVVSKADNLVAISHKQQEIFESHNYRIFGVVYNGIDTEEHQYSLQKDDFLFSLSAIAPHKGQHAAIEVAKASGNSLVIAGNIVNQEYFNSEVKPHIEYDLSSEQDKLKAYLSLPEGPKIVYVGPVNDIQKKPLFAQARAFLMPIFWEEPFGLVAVEALAGATPVIAMSRGALPELVLQGKTGYLCEDGREMVNALQELDKLDYRACRKDAEERFSSEKMARDYLTLYETALRKTKG